jgi:hypothetical protein
MRVLICGSRAWDDELKLWELLDTLHHQHNFEYVIVGGARGADTMAEGWARDRGIHGKRVPANWERDGRGAGFKRNLRMLEMWPDLVVGFIQGESRGSWHTISHARDRGIETLVIQREAT